MMTEQEQRPRIAYLTQGDPHDKRAWSCSLYYIGQALRQHCGDVSSIGPLPLPPPRLSDRLRAKSSRLLRRRYLYETNLRAAYTCGQQAARKLAVGVDSLSGGEVILRPDVIVAVASEAAIAYLETETPMVLVGDTTYAQLVDYFPYYSHISGRSLREIHTIEQRVFAKVRASIFTSEWAARFVIDRYHADPRHVYVVPFGVNLDSIPEPAIANARTRSETCRLLFMGVEWQRKGGDIAYQTLLALRAKGTDAELIVCGCTPPAQLVHKHMTVIPFLNKNDPRQQQQLEQLFITAHFLLLPTRADCAPNVFREASAFGLPVITTNTGGVSGIIHEGENGYMLPLSARGDDYAALIARIYGAEEHYTRIVQSSRAAFEQRLNWDAWGRSIHDILVQELEMGTSTANYAQSSSEHRFSDIRTGTG
ncbi:MAG TPA: glycosyltransferase family 4 protein [Ktedonobacteraceae bacterium]|nr:glycosyltransferase family 4 protein [Ktedonobacteraceae bacterium]